MKNIGVDLIDHEFSSVDSKRPNYQDYDRINKQNFDIAGGEHDGTDDLDLSTGDQIIVPEYANDETEEDTLEEPV